MNQTEIRIRCNYTADELGHQVDGAAAAVQAGEVVQNLESAIGDGLLAGPSNELYVDNLDIGYEVLDTDAGKRYTGSAPSEDFQSHRPITALCGIETCKEAVLSTAHLRESTVKYLDFLDGVSVVYLAEPGVTFMVLHDEISISLQLVENELDLSQSDDIPELNKLADTLVNQYGFDSIRFHSDGGIVKGFPVF